MIAGRQKGISVAVTVGVLLVALSGGTGAAAEPGRIHCVTDISHEFTFYFDGRFGRNYVGENGMDVRNWGTLHKYDFANANLLILQSGASPCRYLLEDTKAVEEFLKEGGGVVVLGEYARFRDEGEYQLNALARHFGAEFKDRRAKKPLKGCGNLEGEEIESYSPKTIELTRSRGWEVLVEDADGNAVMARRAVGKGRLVVASRSLCGQNPNASDPINDKWWKPLLQEVSAGKKVDARRRPRDQMPENKTQRERLPIQYSDYMKPYADAIYGVYDECFPVIQEVMGVPPSEGMLTNLILLPTGGGGFSSGSSIGLAAWWGGFPEKKYGMVELISHESTHSWVHPFVEPMWNEGIATYVGILVGRRMGLEGDANATLEGWISGARRHDPDMNECDLAHGEDVPHNVRMAKPMWVFEELSKERPDIVARYFRAKRRLATRDKMREYTADDSVAVLSIAAGRDLFGWFQSLGITVDRSKAQIEMKELGLFEGSCDVGEVEHAGTSECLAEKGQYRVTGGGENMWGQADAFQYLWREVSGDLELTAKVEWVGSGGNEHRKAGWMVRESLAKDAAYADVMVHGDGLTSLQFRKTEGGETEEVKSPVAAPAYVKLGRHGDVFSLHVSDDGRTYQPAGAVSVPLGDPVYAGLAVCAHDNSTTETALFSDVQVECMGTCKDDDRVVESTLETINIETGQRRIVYRAKRHFEAPNWSRDGKYLLFNGGGKLYTIGLAGGEPELLDTGFADHCNNDHGFSPDGREIVISHHHEGDSLIYILPSAGGTPRLVTELGPSYWHGWSPDGKMLVYCAERNGNYDVYAIGVKGGRETRLTDAEGLDDGPDYSADGRHIYFNSVRTGAMRIWRMDTDGKNQVQMTDDKRYGDWFPHPSPDGKWIVFLSYDKEVEGHPANKDVALRIMSATGGEAKVLARLFGGQGTINVPSWSPDSKHVAFVSYRLVCKDGGD